MAEQRALVSTGASEPAVTTRHDKVKDARCMALREARDSDAKGPGSTARHADCRGAPGPSTLMKRSVRIKLKIYTTESHHAEKTTMARISRGIWSRGNSVQRCGMLFSDKIQESHVTECLKKSPPEHLGSVHQSPRLLRGRRKAFCDLLRGTRRPHKCAQNQDLWIVAKTTASELRALTADSDNSG